MLWSEEYKVHTVLAAESEGHSYHLPMILVPNGHPSHYTYWSHA